MSAIYQPTTYRRTFREIFAVPIFLAIITIVGLLSALLGDGIWNIVSWAALIIPLAVIILSICRHSESGARDGRRRAGTRLAASSLKLWRHR